MNGFIMAKILVELDAAWVSKQIDSEKPPIESFIAAFSGRNPSIVLIRHDETSCDFETFYTTARKEELENELTCALQDSLDIEHNDCIARWKIIVTEQGVERVVSPEELEDHIPEISWQVTLALDSRWVLEHHGDPVLPIERFVKQLRLEFRHFTVTLESLTNCSFVINAPMRQEIEEKLDSAAKKAGISNVIIEKKIALLENVSYEEPLSQGGRKATATAELSAAQRIERLIGAEGFRRLAKELVAVAPQLLSHRTLDSFHRRCYLFTIADGCGLSTQLRSLSLLLRELKLSRGDQRIIEVPPDKTLQEMLEEADGSYLGKTMICYDLSHWMDKIRQPEFWSFLQKLQNREDRPLYIFRIPFVDENTRRKVLAGLNDVFTTQEVVTLPYTAEEFKQYASGLLAEKGFTMEESGWQRFEQRIAVEKSEGQFYGFHSVRKMIDELFYQKHLSVVQNIGEADERTLRPEHFPDTIGAVLDMQTAQE